MTHSRSKPRPPCPPPILIYPLNESETCLWQQKPGYQMEMAVFNSLDSSDRLNHHRRSCRLRHRRPSDHQHPRPCCHLVGRSNLRGCCYCYPKRCEDTLEVRFDNLSRAKYIKDGREIYQRWASRRNNVLGQHTNQFIYRSDQISCPKSAHQNNIDPSPWINW